MCMGGSLGKANTRTGQPFCYAAARWRRCRWLRLRRCPGNGRRRLAVPLRRLAVGAPQLGLDQLGQPGIRVIPQFLPTDRLVIGFDPACERVDLLPVDLHGILIHRHGGAALGRIEERLDEQHFVRGVDDHELTLAGEDGPAEGPFVRAAGPGGSRRRASWPPDGPARGTGCDQPAASGRIRSGTGSVPGGWSCRPSAPAWPSLPRSARRTARRCRGALEIWSAGTRPCLGQHLWYSMCSPQPAWSWRSETPELELIVG